LVIQAAFLIVTLGAVVVIAVTTRNNFHKQQIPFGFDFLWAQTGWDVAMSLVPHSATDPYWRTIAAGLLNTILLSAISLALALLFGVLLGFLSVSANPLLLLSAC
jgi:general L-amino acid transport system permease protein